MERHRRLRRQIKQQRQLYRRRYQASNRRREIDRQLRRLMRSIDYEDHLWDHKFSARRREVLVSEFKRPVCPCGAPAVESYRGGAMVEYECGHVEDACVGTIKPCPGPPGSVTVVFPPDAKPLGVTVYNGVRVAADGTLDWTKAVAIPQEVDDAPAN